MGPYELRHEPVATCGRQYAVSELPSTPLGYESTGDTTAMAFLAPRGRKLGLHFSRLRPLPFTGVCVRTAPVMQFHPEDCCG